MNDNELLRTEFDIHCINVISGKSIKEHAVVRLLVSTLASADEIINLRKSDLKIKGNEQIIRLTSIKGSKSRLSPIDNKTYKILDEISQSIQKEDNIFNYSVEEINEIIRRYSGGRYTFKKLRDSVIRILQDSAFFEGSDFIKDLVEGKDISKTFIALQDTHPMFSGMWDIDDEEVARDFIRTFVSRTGIEDPRKIAEEIGEDEKRVIQLLGD